MTESYVPTYARWACSQQKQYLEKGWMFSDIEKLIIREKTISNTEYLFVCSCHDNTQKEGNYHNIFSEKKQQRAITTPYISSQ